MADDNDAAKATKKPTPREKKWMKELRARKSREIAIDKRAAEELSSNAVADESKFSLSKSVVIAAQRLD